jgi:hypothetical protein
MTNKPPVTRAFQVRPANGSFLDRHGAETPLYRHGAETPLDRHFERIIFLLAKKTQEGRNRPR